MLHSLLTWKKRLFLLQIIVIFIIFIIVILIMISTARVDWIFVSIEAFRGEDLIEDQCPNHYKDKADKFAPIEDFMALPLI